MTRVLALTDGHCVSKLSFKAQFVVQLSRLFVVLLCICVHVDAQTDAPEIAEVQRLAEEQHWSEIVTRLQNVCIDSGPQNQAHRAERRQSGSDETGSRDEDVAAKTAADFCFYYGTALAHLQRWQEAENAFREGSRRARQDPRFLTELAGVAFQQKRLAAAARRMRRALRLDPQSSYANDFLGTVYFLEGNEEAALKYWNRIDKPRIVEVRSDPIPRVDPALLDRAFAFSPASTLHLTEFLTTDARLRSLGIFPRYQLDLLAREDNSFDVTFRNQERNLFGANKWEALFLLFRGLPFLAINPEIYNLRHEAINFVSLFRWDPQKRRIDAEFSSPFERSAKYRYGITADLRNENWSLVTSFQGPTQNLGSFNLRREILAFDLASFANGRWHWSAGAELSHRDFRSVVPGPALNAGLLAKGYQLKQITRFEADLWRAPEHRFTLDAELSSQVARLWSQPQESFEKLQEALRWQWFPQAQGDDYAMQQQIRAGKTFGTVPFDELFILGLERDNDLPMRAHIGTRDGRKGSAPMGRTYFLANWETDKNLYGNGLLSLKLGPFLDTGKISRLAPGLNSSKWLWDTGAHLKLKLLGATMAFSYGKDLRSGNNAFYLTTHW